MAVAQLKNYPRPTEYAAADDDKIYSTRSPSSARRYQPPKNQNTRTDLPVQQKPFIQHRRASSVEEHQTEVGHEATQGPFIQRRRASSPLHTNNGITTKAIVPPLIEARHRLKHFPLKAVILGMLLTIILAIGLSTFGSWWHIRQDDIQYGRPRTFQLDAVIGHADSATHPTHLIFINLHQHVEIIELPGGDGAHARIYLGPILYGDGQDLTPITAEVRDVNADGKPDLILHIQDQRIIFLNDGTTFHPQQSGDHVPS